MKALDRLLVALGLLLFISHCHAGDWPARPITLIVPYAAGGPMDKLARDLIEQLRDRLTQPIVVENVAGAGGNLGVSRAKRAAADGYTLLLDHMHMAVAPGLNKKLDFNPELDFEPLGVVAESPLLLVTRLGIPASTMPELLHWAVKQPLVTMANAGPGSASYLCGLLVQRSLRVELTPIPYRGTGPAMIDLMGGHVDLLCDLASNALPQVVSKRVAGVAISVPSKVAVTLPSFATYGIRDAELSIWYAIYAPKGIPSAVSAHLTAALRSALADPGFNARQAESGMVVLTDWRSTPEGHRKHLHQELKRWGPILQALTE